MGAQIEVESAPCPERLEEPSAGPWPFAPAGVRPLAAGMRRSGRSRGLWPSRPTAAGGSVPITVGVPGPGCWPPPGVGITSQYWAIALAEP